MASQRQVRISRRSRSAARVDALVAIAALVAAIVGYFELVQPVLQGDAPAAVMRHMCADEMHQDYTAVYTLLSSSFIQRFRLTPSSFVHSQQGRDQGIGPMRACTVVGRDFGASFLNTDAAFRVTATLDDGHFRSTDTGTIRLEDENGWKISDEQIDDILFFAG
jgi:hypothetical protein